MRVLPGLVRDGFVGALNSSLGLALRGPYFMVRNATIGTGIAMGIQTTYSATANVLLLLYNGGTKTMVMDYLKLINTAAGSTTTSSHIAIRLDAKDRYSSGGTSVVANVTQPDGGSDTSSLSSGKAYFGIVTANAEGSSVRTACRNALKIAAAPCWAVNDTVVLSFGNVVTYSSLATTTATIMSIFAGALIIPAGWSATFHMWNVANATTAPSWEFEAAWLEI